MKHERNIMGSEKGRRSRILPEGENIFMTDAESEECKRQKAEAKLNKDNREEKADIDERQSNDSGIIFPVSSLDDYWEIPNVEYRNGIYVVKLSKKLLDSGNTRTQDEWIEYSRQARTKGEFYTGSMALQYAMFRALSERQTSESLEARNFIQTNMRGRWLMTTTRLKYKPSKKDEILQDYKLPDELKSEIKLVGPDKQIDSGDSKILECLLLDSDVDRIKRVFEFINETPVYLWRLNSTPKKIDERVAGFYASSDGALLDCLGYLSYASSSLGVFAVAQDGSNARLRS